MACTAQVNRPKTTVVAVAELDDALYRTAKAYAARFDVPFQMLVEAALVNFMYAQMIPEPMQVCSTHGVVLEHNSSGTAVACPVNEGATAVFYLGGETPHDGDEPSGYKPEGSVLYNGEPDSGSIRKR